MRVFVQRVKEASVKVNQSVIGQIQKGYLLYIGIHQNDDLEIIKKMATKVTNLRVFEDSEGKLNLNIKAVQGKILAISQFTLYGDAKSNNRPSFTEAAPLDKALSLYNQFVQLLKENHHVETGEFRAHMDIYSINDGPVSILLEIDKT
jgi:D-aminoacyl-tRNA deacylase